MAQNLSCQICSTYMKPWETDCPSCGTIKIVGLEKCPICSCDITEKSNFCSNCGNPFSFEKVKFIQAINLGFTNIFNFNGRATRAEFWWWHLFITLSFSGINLFVLYVARGGGDMTLPVIGEVIWGLIASGLCLSISVRRLHDTNRHGWWAIGQFYSFFYSLLSVSQGVISQISSVGTVVCAIPLFWLIICACRKGHIGNNKYGPDLRTITR